MKKSKIWNVFSLVFWIALAASEILISYQIHRLNMLPNKYLMIVYGALALIALLIGLLVIPVKKQKRHGRQIVGYLLCVVVIAGCAVGTYAISKVNKTISNVTQPNVVSGQVDIYVLKNNRAQSLSDVQDYTFGITEVYDWENTKQAIADLEAEFGHSLDTVSYDTVPAMIDGLYAGEVNALLLNSAYVDILSDVEGYSDFADLSRVVHQQIVEVEVTEPATVPTEPGETSPEEIEENPNAFIVYISGSDTRSNLLRQSRSDVNILAVVNTETKQILLINTPRDCYVSNPAGNGAMDKLTHCGLYGPSCSVEALEDLYDTNIRYYAQLNFTGVETLIDALGGVTIYSDEYFYAENAQFYVEKGENHLNGKQAVAVARERYRVKGGDQGRGKNQMKIIAAIINKLSSGTTLITRYSEILDSLEGMFATNMTHEEMSELVKMQLSDMAKWNIQSVALTGKSGTDRTWASGGLFAYVLYPYENVVDQISVLIDRVCAGDILTEEDLVLTN